MWGRKGFYRENETHSGVTAKINRENVLIVVFSLCLSITSFCDVLTGFSTVTFLLLPFCLVWLEVSQLHLQIQKLSSHPQDLLPIPHAYHIEIVFSASRRPIQGCSKVKLKDNSKR